jgi:hypothetical protein
MILKNILMATSIVLLPVSQSQAGKFDAKGESETPELKINNPYNTIVFVKQDGVPSALVCLSEIPESVAQKEKTCLEDKLGNAIQDTVDAQNLKEAFRKLELALQISMLD